MLKIRHLFILCLSAVLITAMLMTGCGTSTKLLGSWSKYPDKPTHFNNIAIIGLAKRTDVRKVFEDKMEIAMRAQGFIANGALTFLPPEANKDNIDRKLVIAFLESVKADAVMLISLLRKEDKKEYVSGGFYYNYGYTDVPFNDYYGQMGSYVYAPGYEVSSTDVFLEVNLYTFPEGILIWTGQTQTVDFSSVELAATQLSEVVVKDLVAKNVLSVK